MFRNEKSVVIALAVIFVIGLARPLRAAEGVKLLYGFEGPGNKRSKKLIHVEKHATEGKQSATCKISGHWFRGGSGYAKDDFSRLVFASPQPDCYHDLLDWFWQRHGHIISDAMVHRSEKRDWSAYDRLRVDVYSEKAGCVLGVRIQDSNGPKAGKYGYLGQRTALATFKIPKDKQVTIDVPMADLARVAEMDMSKAAGFQLRFNGYEKGAVLHIDNVRLVTKEAIAKDAKYPLIGMEEEVSPFKRKVIYKPTKRFPDKMKRRTGPVEKLGPVDITVAPGRGSWGGHFGGDGGVYSQSLRRGCVAYDNDRLCLVFSGTAIKNGKRVNSGTYATASFDGGKTWGGLKSGDKEAVWLRKWYTRCTGSSDYTGDIYVVGTENCTSYREGYDAIFYRLAFTGEGWEEDRVSLIDQNMRKCPGNCRAWRLPNGRLWATWCHKRAGLEHGPLPEYNFVKYSDDDGYTWPPCKDASIDTLPRPFYEAKRGDLRKPPKEILLWPSRPAPGAVLMPYGDGIAILGHKEWDVHDGNKWLPRRKMPPLGGNAVVATVLGKDHIFLARSHYQPTKQGTGSKLECAQWINNKWTTETLEEDGVVDVTLTACREQGKESKNDAVFCFYFKVVEKDGAIVNEVRYRRWKTGKWGNSQLLATEKDFKVNHVTAPIICPPDYAAAFWDERRSKASRTEALRFMRIPNN